MIQIIDYQVDNLYGLINNQYGTVGLKINDVEFKLEYQKEVTITSLPDKIYKQFIIPITIDYFINADDKTLSLEDYNNKKNTLLSCREYDGDEDESLWITREDKIAYDEFIKEWKSVYTKEQVGWREEKFEIVVKEFIPEKYRDFIKSSIIINTENKLGSYKAICTYHANPSLTIRKVAVDLGFTEVPDMTFSDNTLGKHFSVNTTSTLEYSKVNNVFLKLDKNHGIFRVSNGSLQQCIDRYQKDYDLVYNKFLIQKNLIENKQVNPEERTELYNLLGHCIIHYHKIDASKKTMSDYNALGRTLTNLKNKIVLIDDKAGN